MTKLTKNRYQINDNDPDIIRERGEYWVEYRAIATGITHSKHNYDKVSSVSFKNGSSRKFVTNNGNLIGVLILEKNLNKKELKPLIKKSVYQMVNVNDYKTDLLKKNFNFKKLIENNTVIPDNII